MAEPKMEAPRVGAMLESRTLRAGQSLRFEGKDDIELAQGEAARAQKAEYERAKGDMIQVLKMPEARRVMFRLIAIGRPYSTSLERDRDGRVDPLIVAFNEGRRDISLAILELIAAADPNAYLQMQREHASDIESKKKEARKNA